MKKVAIIMGSDSDLDVMQGAAQILDQFEVEYELTIVSAHRTPKRMYDFAEAARQNGFEVIIAGAGGAAHLPGMVAAISDLPVIGVPVSSKSLKGMDSLLSIVQMPKGIPVATVAINNSSNAGLLAVRILSINNPVIAEKLKWFNQDQENTVIKKAEKLEKIGYKSYLEED